MHKALNTRPEVKTLDKPTRADFEQWANSPVTMMVRNHLLEQRHDMNSLDQSGMLEDNVYANGSTPIETLGLESVMRMSVIRGIDSFTDFDGLINDLYAEVQDDSEA